MYDEDYDDPGADQEWLLREVARDRLAGRLSIHYDWLIDEQPELWARVWAEEEAAHDAAVAQVAEVEEIVAELAPRIGDELAVPTEVEQVRQVRERLGRKFEVGDLTVGLKQFARSWVEGLGTRDEKFSPEMSTFLVSVKTSFDRRGTLTDGQAKAVLNIATAAKPEWMVEKERREQEQIAAHDQIERAPEITEGMYVHDGEIYKVQRAVHGSGRLYAKVLVVHDQNFDFQHGMTGGNATFEFAKGMVYKLKPEEKMTLEQAAEYGRLYGVCCVCGATLTDEDSIAAGIGPICASKGWW